MDDSYQFRNIYGSHHIIYPHDGGQVIKRIVRRGMRSAREQYEIHKIATDFKHPILRIPSISSMIDDKSYSMEQIYAYQKIHPILMCMNTVLKDGMVDYYNYMIKCGYFPYGHTILFTGLHIVIIDFSQYGTIQGERVYFKHIHDYVNLSDAQIQFGVESYNNVVFLDNNDENDENNLVIAATEVETVENNQSEDEDLPRF